MKTRTQWGKFTPPRKLCAIFLGLCTNLMVAQAQTPDLGTLAKTKGASIKYVAIGSSLSAGVRNGGVYAAAQQTSFPALLAQQMGITDFKQPLLEGNGTGNKSVSVDKNGVLKFTETKDFDDTKKDATLPKVIGEVDNMAVPYQKVIDIFEGNENNVSPLFDNRSFRHLERNLASNDTKKVSYLELLPKKTTNIDFFTFELGWHDFAQYISSGGYGTYISYMVERESRGELVLLEFFASKQAKGIIANVPNMLKFPVFKQYNLQNIQKFNGIEPIYIEHWSKTHVREATVNDIFLPQSAVESLLNPTAPLASKVGLSVENPLNDEAILDTDEQRFASPNGYNLLLSKYAEKYKLPVVDLYALYEKVLTGSFVTNDGVKIDPSYPSGNFFSTDGITPTALGQAIITNEFIKVINATYGAKIPLLATKSFIGK